MERYSIIREKRPREIVLLRGSGCVYRRCTFCDYHLDCCPDPEANFALNREVLGRVTGEYGELLQSDAVLYNYAEGMIRGAQLVSVVPDCKAFLSERDGIVFEGAQGLLLDSEYKKYAPHLTSSRTGLTNPAALCGKYGLSLDLAVYVMRSYVTRHGAGPLPYERDRSEIGNISADRTNQKNEWQGSLRYAVYESPEALAETILSDLSDKNGALFITHLNETDGFIRFATGDVAAADLADHPAFCGKIKKAFLSSSPFSDDVIKITL